MNASSNLKCRSCGKENTVKTYSCINVGKNPELKDKVLDGSLFIWECDSCGARNLVSDPMVYIDPSEKLIIVLSPETLSFEIPLEGEFSGFSSRQVGTIGELIEMVKIFDAGLDDAVIDLCKQVSSMEMEKPDAKFKFLRLDGADNEIIFTFPEDGEMKMIAIGFNVYEDCKAIIDGHRH